MLARRPFYKIIEMTNKKDSEYDVRNSFYRNALIIKDSK